MKAWAAKLLQKARFNSIGIVKKMTIGYFVIIFVPVIAFGLYYYNQLNSSLMEEYAFGKQQLLTQAHASLQMDVLQIESNYGLFQYNSNLVRYLNGDFQSEGEYAYNYLRHIRPIVSYVHTGNSNIGDIKIYKKEDSVFRVPQKIIPLASLDPKLRQDIGQLKPGQGGWFTTPSEDGHVSLTYYQNMYADQFTKHIGVLAIELNDEMLQRFEAAIGNEGRSSVHLLPERAGILDLPELPELTEDVMARIVSSPEGYVHLENKGTIINSLIVDKLDLRVMVVSQSNEVFRNMQSRIVVMALTIAGLLFLLSAIYYWVASSVTRRILTLARHMRKVGADNFRMLEHRQDQDEIGYLTFSYNRMLGRIDELVNTVQRSELLRKEAAYKVLQAQIKPHFLYNTLETIRMLAEQNDDQEVAEITFSFGQLMRYSLSHEREDTRLGDELKNVDHYLNIHKTRLGPRLSFDLFIQEETKRVPCPRFILQPLVENSIVHGISPASRGGRIELAIIEDEEVVTITISDNGVGMAPERLETIRQVLEGQVDIGQLASSDGGHGLYNVSERIKAFYGDGSRLSIASSEGEGTVIRLYLSKKGC
ncbi:sensor histidine kinase [Paenibacillus sp. 1P07SE]|uniref:sensor histidine kinase n=1 Tax=Paenibacillus sp. 1P07SE TaxID=3132209 RepID=UPI0039A53CA6